MFAIYAGDKVTSTNQFVEVVGFDASGKELVRKEVSVSSN
ncbi:conserved hypothetical protein [Carnobacterium maltaromaticum]|nr:conserved hypothetical protein [Carnobacterium maltaromaticum]